MEKRKMLLSWQLLLTLVSFLLPVLSFQPLSIPQNVLNYKSFGFVPDPCRTKATCGTQVRALSNIDDAALTSMDPAATVPDALHLAYNDESVLHCLHKGRTAKFMLRWPSMVSYTLSREWSDDTVATFSEAVEKVVKLNPILTGKVIKFRRRRRWFRRRRRRPKGDDEGGKRGLEIRIQPGTFSSIDHSFVTHVAAPADIPSPKGLTKADALSYMEKEIVPLLDVKCETVAEQIKREKPLFETRVVMLPDGYACFCVKLSHCLGDGVVYYHLIDQLCHFINHPDETAEESKVHKIDWNHPLKATHEAYPEDLSPRDIRRSYGFPFYFGLFRNFKRLIDPKSEYLVLSRDKIKKKQRDLRMEAADAGNPEHISAISSNEIVMSALCQLNLSTDIFAFPHNIRGTKVGVEDPYAAGYFCCEIPFAKEAALEPIELRKIITRCNYFASNEIPLRPFIQGRVGRMTNWASITSKSLFTKWHAGMETVCHCAPTNFLDIFPMDVGIIFRLDEHHLGVMHNFKETQQSPLLEEIAL